MSSWLTSPPALITGLLASVIGIGQALPTLARKIVLFPRRRAERQLGQVVMSIVSTDYRNGRLKALVAGLQPPEGQDWSIYKA